MDGRGAVTRNPWWVLLLIHSGIQSVKSYKPLGVTMQEVKSHAARLLENVNIRMLVLGNLYKDVCVHDITPIDVD